MKRTVRLFPLQLAIICAFGVIAFWSSSNLLVRTITWSDFSSVWSGQEEEIFDNPRFSGGSVFRWIEEYAPDGTKFLTYRQAELSYYFPHMKWDYDFSPDLMPLYTDVQSGTELISFIQERGIEYVLIPGYYPETYYNSLAGTLFGDPRFVEEVANDGSYRLLRILTDQRSAKCRTSLLSSGELFFYRGEGVATRLSISDGLSGGHFLQSDNTGSNGLSGVRATTEGKTTKIVVAKPPETLDLMATSGAPLIAPGGTLRPSDANTVVLDGQVSGNGMLAVYLLEYEGDGRIHSRLIWDGIVGSGGDLTTTLKAFGRLRPDTAAARVMFRWDEGSAFTGKLELDRICFAKVTSIAAHEDTGTATTSEEARTPVVPESAGGHSGNGIKMLSWHSNDRLLLNVQPRTNYGVSEPVDGANLTTWWENADKGQVQAIAVPSPEAEVSVIAGAPPPTDESSGPLGQYDAGGSFEKLRLAIDEAISAWTLRILQDASSTPTMVRIAMLAERHILAVPQDSQTVLVEMRADAGRNVVVTPTLYWRNATGRPHATSLQPRTVGFDAEPDRWVWLVKIGKTAADPVVKLDLRSFESHDLPMIKIRSIDLYKGDMHD